MKNILYANPFSIFDYTSGSAQSIRLFLENFKNLGHNVYSICSCNCYSKAGFLNTLEVINNHEGNSFIYRGINCKIINSLDWDRRKLSINEEKEFFNETINLTTI